MEIARQAFRVSREAYHIVRYCSNNTIVNGCGFRVGCGSADGLRKQRQCGVALSSPKRAPAIAIERCADVRPADQTITTLITHVASLPRRHLPQSLDQTVP